MNDMGYYEQKRKRREDMLPAVAACFAGVILAYIVRLILWFLG